MGGDLANWRAPRLRGAIARRDPFPADEKAIEPLHAPSYRSRFWFIIMNSMYRYMNSSVNGRLRA